MRALGWIVLLCASLSLLACGGGEKAPPAGQETASAAADTLLAQGRAATNKLQAALKQKLSEAIQEGGAANALTVCNVKALPLTRQVGEELGVTVGRVSLRNRNPDNAPDEQEAAVLVRFDQAGAPTDTLVTLADGRHLYMRAIRITSPLCLNCHGVEEDLAEGVPERLAELYPGDEATEYHEGELRGAFTVLFPAAE